MKIYCKVHYLTQHHTDIYNNYYDAFFASLRKIENFFDQNSNLKLGVTIRRKKDLKSLITLV